MKIKESKRFTQVTKLAGIRDEIRSQVFCSPSPCVLHHTKPYYTGQKYSKSVKAFKIFKWLILYCAMESSKWSYEFRKEHITLSAFHLMELKWQKVNDLPKVTDNSGLKSEPNPVSWPGAVSQLPSPQVSLFINKVITVLVIVEENPHQPQEVALGREEGVTHLWLRADRCPGGQGNPPSRWGNKPHPWLFVWTFSSVPLAPSPRTLLWPKPVIVAWSNYFSENCN